MFRAGYPKPCGTTCQLPYLQGRVPQTMWHHMPAASNHQLTTVRTSLSLCTVHTICYAALLANSPTKTGVLFHPPICYCCWCTTDSPLAMSLTIWQTKHSSFSHSISLVSVHCSTLLGAICHLPVWLSISAHTLQLSDRTFFKNYIGEFHKTCIRNFNLHFYRTITTVTSCEHSIHSIHILQALRILFIQFIGKRKILNKSCLREWNTHFMNSALLQVRQIARQLTEHIATHTVQNLQCTEIQQWL